MQPLVDMDVLVYEIGFSSQKMEEGVVVPSSWDFVTDLLRKRIDVICAEVDATHPPIGFLTNSKYINSLLNKRRRFAGEDEVEYVENFRVAAAKEKTYKGTRKAEKPYHYYNIINHMINSYHVVVNEGGLEADDMMCVYQYDKWKQGDFSTIICSRDKDVRQCPGNHYSWEIAKQPSIGPLFVQPLGQLNLTTRYDDKGKIKDHKVFGTGQMFFYYQLLVGDTVDNIGGIKGKGPAFAHNLLKDCTTEVELYNKVQKEFEKAYKENWKKAFREQADLLFMIRDRNEKGWVKWKPPS